MINIHLFSLCVLIAFYSCDIKDSNQAISEVKENLKLSLKKIIINHYEDDSLNNNRNLVLPIMYYDFEAINNSIDTLGIKLDVHGNYKNPINAWVTFDFPNKKDTLVLSNFANENEIVFPPNDSTNFIIKGFIPDLHEYLDIMSAKELMRKIAENGYVTFKIKTFSRSNKTSMYINVKRSDDFRMEFRDPNDTTIE